MKKTHEELSKLLTADEKKSRPITLFMEEAGTITEAELRFANRMSKEGLGYEVTMIKESRITEIDYYQDPADQ